MIARLPACDAALLAARWSDSGASAGTAVTRVQLVNRSARVCALRGHPVSLTGVAPGGATVPLKGGWTGGGSAYVEDQPAILAKDGGAADVALLTHAVCGRSGPAVAALRIGLPTGTVTVPYTPGPDSHAPFRFTCPPSVTDFAQWSGSFAGWAEQPGLLGLLASAPGRFVPPRRSGVLTNGIVLSNVTAHAIRLGPCPSYTESLTVDRVKGIRPVPARAIARASYRLNCAAARVIPAHRSVRFMISLSIRAHIAGRLHVTGGTLVWRLNVLDGTGPEARSYWCASCATAG
jgi:hypothetical protein